MLCLRNKKKKVLVRTIKAGLSVTFDLLILELMFLFFKNTVKKLKFMYTFYQFRKSNQHISIKPAVFRLK